MPLEIKGYQELIDKMHDTTEIADKAGNIGLKKAGEIVREAQYREVVRTHDKYSEKIGRQELKAYPIRSKKTGKYISIGLKAKGQVHRKDDSKGRSSHWSKIKGLVA